MMRRLSGACLAALVVVSLVAAKPPDLPYNPRITVAQPPADSENAPADPGLPIPLGNVPVGVSALHFLGVHPFVAWEGTCEAPEPRSICPHLQQQADRQSHSLNDASFVDEACKEIEAAVKQASGKEAENQEVACDCCPCCWWLNQFGMCWMSRVLDWCKLCCEEKAGAQEESEEHPCDTVCGTIERKLQRPFSADCKGMPLSKVLDEIRDHFSLPIVVDQEALKKAGIASPDAIAVTFHVEQMPLRVALDMLLRPHHLKAEVTGCVLCITAMPASTQGEGEEAGEEPAAKSCGSACPKCEEMHAKCAGIEEQVTGLMKACYLAMGEGRFEKAADLAREAHALDPARVEGDPLIYKMHLLAEKCTKPCPATKCPSTPCQGANNQPDPAACDAPVQAIRPALPAVNGDTVPALDAVLTGKDEEGKDSEKHGEFQIGLGLDLECFGVSLEQVKALLGGKLEAAPEKNTVVLGLSPLGDFSIQGTVPCNGCFWSFTYRGGALLLWPTPERGE
jgi:hypothetical protein